MNEARSISLVPGLVGVLCALPALAGCAGTLDPELAAEASGAGGTGTGGTTPTGGAGGAGGTNCTGGNDGAALKAPNDALLCSNSGVHGASMPYGSVQLLPAVQQACIEEWAQGLVMAAP